VKGGKGAAPRTAKKVKVKPATKSPFYMLLGVIAVAAVALIAMQVMRPTSSGVVTVDRNIPLPEGKGYLMGDAYAPVQIVEFADFECPACGSFATLTEPDMKRRLVETGQVSFRFMDYPLEMHENAWDAHFAAACANEQGKFWEMHDALFNTQDRWNTQATNRPKGVMSLLARQVGVDMAQWDECFDSQEYKLQIAANQREGDKWMVSSTPTFVIGDKVVRGLLSYDQLKILVDSALANPPRVMPLPQGDTAVPPGPR
jgi:protein-disulfide isomerase